MDTSKSKKAAKPAVEELTEGMVELTESESDVVAGGVTEGGVASLLMDGSVRYHGYKTQGPIVQEKL